MNVVQWRPIPGYEGRYEVSSEGQVRSVVRRTPRILAQHSPRTRRVPYPQIVFWTQGKPACFKVHVLVLLAFVGPRPEGMEACHNDRDFTNNRVENLRWDTHTENIKDRERHGHTARGERIGKAKLTAEQVAEIRRTPGTITAVGDAFGVANSTISCIRRGATWKHTEKAA